MKRLFFFSILLFVLLSSGFVLAHFHFFLHLGGVIVTAILAGAFFGTAFGALDMRERNADQRTRPVRTRSSLQTRTF